MGPYITMWYHKDHTGPYGTIEDHRGPYGTIWDHMGPYGTIQDHREPNIFVTDSLTHGVTN